MASQGCTKSLKDIQPAICITLLKAYCLAKMNLIAAPTEFTQLNSLELLKREETRSLTKFRELVNHDLTWVARAISDLEKEYLRHQKLRCSYLAFDRLFNRADLSHHGEVPGFKTQVSPLLLCEESGPSLAKYDLDLGFVYKIQVKSTT